MISWSVVCTALKDTCELLQGCVSGVKRMPSVWYHQQCAAKAYVSVNRASVPMQTTAHAMVIDSCYLWTYYLGGADKSLALPTSLCRRTESTVSLKKGICPCAELQVFSCYRGWKEACQATRAISTTSRRELSLIFYPARQGAEGNSRHSHRTIRGTCTIVC